MNNYYERQHDKSGIKIISFLILWVILSLILLTPSIYVKLYINSKDLEGIEKATFVASNYMNMIDEEPIEKVETSDFSFALYRGLGKLDYRGPVYVGVFYDFHDEDQYKKQKSILECQDVFYEINLSKEDYYKNVGYFIIQTEFYDHCKSGNAKFINRSESTYSISLLSNKVNTSIWKNYRETINIEFEYITNANEMIAYATNKGLANPFGYPRELYVFSFIYAGIFSGILSLMISIIRMRNKKCRRYHSIINRLRYSEGITYNQKEEIRSYFTELEMKKKSKEMTKEEMLVSKIEFLEEINERNEYIKMMLED